MANPLGNLLRATSDVHYMTHGGLFTSNYYVLYDQLNELSKNKILPNNYASGVLRPFIKFLENLGEKDFRIIFEKDLKDLDQMQRHYRKIIPDVAEALLQRKHEGVYYSSSYNALLAFQSVVTSIYQTILDKNIQTVSKAILPPLAKWGKSRSPYTWTVQSTHKLGLYAGIVSLPPENRDGGLLAWSALGHEVAGHNFLCSNKQLLPELEKCVYDAVSREYPEQPLLATYWQRCTEEITSDILGVLNIGPVSAAALIGYFRGVRGGRVHTKGLFPLGAQRAKTALKLYSNPQGNIDYIVRGLPDYVKLPKNGGLLGEIEDGQVVFESYFEENEKHPVDVLRPFALVSVIDSLSDLDEKIRQKWTSSILVEAEKDAEFVIEVDLIQVDAEKPQKIHHSFNIQQAIKAGQVAALAIINTPLTPLNNKKLIDIFSWTSSDEKIVEKFKNAIINANIKAVSKFLKKESSCARYIVAAATQLSLEENNVIEKIFETMKVFLVEAYKESKTRKKADHVLMQLDLDEDVSLEPRHYFGVQE